MASLHFLIAIAIVAIVVPPALAAEYVVGDGKGWTLNFDQSWAEGKQFNVGDKLIFNYPQGAHNVYRVNGTSFQQCVPPAGVEALTTGNDVITLTTPGRKWYICGVGKHCESGNMKLAITVMPQLESPAASPSSGGAPPSSAATGVAISKYHAGMIGLFSILVRIIMV